MSDINTVIIEGRVGSDPYIDRSGNKPRATFSLANDQSYKNRDGEKVEKTSWVNCTSWGSMVDFIEKWIKKGEKLTIQGKIETRSFEKDGQNRTVTDIIIENISKHVWKKQDNNQNDDFPFDN